MAVEYFVSVLRAKYAALSAADRKRIIREMVAESREHADFVKKHFPEFYAEAFAGRSPKANPVRKLVGKRAPAKSSKRRKTKAKSKPAAPKR